MKQLVHRIGFLSWVGEDAIQQEYLPRLISAYEKMDPEMGFRNLQSVGTTLLTGKHSEKQALAEMTAILREIWESRVREGRVPDEMNVTKQVSGDTGRGGKKGDDGDDDAEDDGVRDNLASLHMLYRDHSDDDRFRQVGVDIFQFHVASQV